MPGFDKCLIVFALSLAPWLGACSPIKEPAADAARIPDSPITAETLAGPVALAPSLTGAPATPALPEASPAKPAAPPAEPPASTAMSAAAPARCPPGSIAMWSQPDAAGTAVSICRRLNPAR